MPCNRSHESDSIIILETNLKRLETVTGNLLTYRDLIVLWFPSCLLSVGVQSCNIGPKSVYEQTGLQAHLLPGTSHMFEMTTHKHHFLGRVGSLFISWSVSAHLWQMQTLLHGLLSACHSCQAMGLAPCSVIQLSSSSDTTSPIAYPVLFHWKWSHRFKNK